MLSLHPEIVVSSLITCYHCTNTSIHLCSNTSTITCRKPADSCYVLLSQDRKTISKSCVWKGHCSPHTLCNGLPSCNLQCCSEGDLCNAATDDDNWVTDADPVNWCYIILLYLILPSLLALAHVAFSLPPLPPSMSKK